jgi:hypothetical protein
MPSTPATVTALAADYACGRRGVVVATPSAQVIMIMQLSRKSALWR